MKKIILTLYTKHSAGSAPFTDKKYQRCYESLYELGKPLGLHLCRAPLAWYDKEQGIFLKTWEYTNGEWVISGPVKPDLIFDKTAGAFLDDETRLEILRRYPVVGDPEFTKFASSKFNTSKLLPQYFKPYSKVTNREQLQTFLRTLSGELVVIKPDTGSGGAGVHIVSKQEALEIDIVYPVIAQEFIDSSRGIPGITNGHHDLRLTFIGDDLVYSYIRTPRPGSLLANLAQGGSMKIVSRKKLPASLAPIVRDVQNLFSRFRNKIYTIDLMFDEHSRPWIVEFNTMPGMFFPPNRAATMRRVYRRLLKEFVIFFESEKHEKSGNERMVTGMVIFSDDSAPPEKPFANERLRQAYMHFFQLAKTHGLELYRAATDWYDKNSGIFLQAWHWGENGWHLVSNVRPQVIYDKASNLPSNRAVKEMLAKKFLMINPPAFSSHAGNKLLVSQTFPNYCKPYFSCENVIDLKRALEKIPGEVVVSKPGWGNSGEGILIQPKSQFSINLPAFPCLIQEFVDSRLGIPGVMSGLHDLRLIFSNEDLVYAYFRTPEAGSYLANVAQGGTQTMVSQQDLPESVWEIVRAVQKYYQKYPQKIYTIDLIFDQDSRPWIVELNTMPGLYPDESERPYISKLYLAIIHALLSEARKKK